MIRTIVDKLVKKYKTRDPFELADCLNAIVLSVPLKGVRGFYQYFKRNDIIYIDSSLPYHEKRLVCAHELGHLIMHRKTNSFKINTYTSLNTSKYEKEANIFAVNLLIEDSDLEEYREYTVGQLACLYGLSESLIKLRLDMEV